MNTRRFRTPLAIAAAMVSVVAVAQPAAAEPTWLPAKTIYTDNSRRAQPDMAINASGEVSAIWNAGTGLKAARKPVGGNWSISTITTSGSYRVDTQTTLDDHGRALAVWEQQSDSTYTRIRAAARSAGGTWSTPITISGSVPGGRFDLAADGEGNAVAAWLTHEGHINRVRAAYKRAGGSWSAPVTISPLGINAKEPRVAADGKGGMLAAWAGEGATPSVHVARRSTGGTWSSVHVTAEGTVGEVRIASDGAGSATAVWSYRHTDGSIRLSVIDRPSGGDWGVPADLTGTGQWFNAFDLAINAKGTATLVWSYMNHANTTVQAARRPKDGSWSMQGTISTGAADERAAMPKVAVDDLGNAFAIWTAGAAGTVYGATQSADGTWATPTRLSATSLEGIDPQVTADGRGSALTMWRADGDGVFRVQARAFDATGPATTMVRPTYTRQRSTSFAAEWRAIDRWSAVARRDVRYRVAAWDAGFGTHADWLSATTANSATFIGEPGRTYCFSARATDTVNNLGSWSSERCTATPVDDRTMTSGGGWWRSANSDFYQGTYTGTSTNGAKLTLNGVQARHLSLLASTCSSCGSVKVSLNGTSLGTFSLTSSSTTRKALISVKTFSEVQTGTVTVEVVSSTGKPVHLDGLVVKR